MFKNKKEKEELREEIKVKLEERKLMLNIMTNLLPEGNFKDFMKESASFTILDNEIGMKLCEDELSDKKVKEIISVYKQMKNILNDILNK